jgi:hypothetical protein
MSDLTDIHSPFNACMFREHCRGEIDRLRVTVKMLQDDRAALMLRVAVLEQALLKVMGTVERYTPPGYPPPDSLKAARAALKGER